jgi:predicted peptidase
VRVLGCAVAWTSASQTPACLSCSIRARADTRESPPLIVFLHGSGERGDTVTTLEAILVHSLPWLAANQRLPCTVDGMAFPFLIICPQTSRTLWKDDATRVIDLINEVCGTEGADPARCYLSGVSMGGGGCWDIAAVAPHRFAALMPISGRVRVVPQTRERPAVWLFHGAHDGTNPARQALERLRAGRAKQALTRLEIDFSAGHNPAFWNRIYARAEVYRWLLEQTAVAPTSA